MLKTTPNMHCNLSDKIILTEKLKYFYWTISGIPMAPGHLSQNSFCGVSVKRQNKVEETKYI